MPSAVSWLKAMVEPKLMEIRRMETMEVVRMALRGMSWRTWHRSQYWLLIGEGKNRDGLHFDLRVCDSAHIDLSIVTRRID